MITTKCLLFKSGVITIVRLDGGACWIDNYMGIDDNNCILCVSKTCDNDTVLILLRTLYALNLCVSDEHFV